MTGQRIVSERKEKLKSSGRTGKDMIEASDDDTKFGKGTLGMGNVAIPPADLFPSNDKLTTGISILRGINTKRIEMRKGIAYVIEAMRNGNVVAEGLCNLNGWGGRSKTPLNAVQCFQVAVEKKNHPLGLLALGRCYLLGLGVEKDVHIGFGYLQKALEAGSIGAHARLGTCYALGLGVEQNIAKAVGHFEKGAEVGDSIAQLSLGQHYLHGIGVVRDRRKAVALTQDVVKRGFSIELQIDLWETLAQDGNPIAELEIGRMYMLGRDVQTDVAKAVGLYSRAACQGITAADSNLGICFMHGIGVKIDMERALTHFVRSAQKGCGVALYQLAIMHARGLCLPADDVKAQEYLRRAAAKNVEAAKEALESLRKGDVLESQEVVCHESQRYYLRSGWSAHLLPTDPSPWSSENGKLKLKKENVPIPQGWSWVNDWELIIQVPNRTDENGWRYAVDFGTLNSFFPNSTNLRFVRRRTWRRTLAKRNRLKVRDVFRDVEDASTAAYM